MQICDEIGSILGANQQVEVQTWLVSFMDYDLEYFDNERGRMEPGTNSFTPDNVLTMCPEQRVNHVTG